MINEQRQYLLKCLGTIRPVHGSVYYTVKNWNEWKHFWIGFRPKGGPMSEEITIDDTLWIMFFWNPQNNRLNDFLYPGSRVLLECPINVLPTEKWMTVLTNHVRTCRLWQFASLMNDVLERIPLKAIMSGSPPMGSLNHFKANSLAWLLPYLETARWNHK